MLKNMFVVAALVLLGASASIAQTSPAPAPSDTHKNYDQKARECRKLAKDQGLSGEALRAFISDCIKH